MINADEARALLAILDEVGFVGIQEFARFDDKTTAHAESAREKLRVIASRGGSLE